MKINAEFEKIEESINMLSWYRFSDKSFECPGEVNNNMIDFFRKNKKFPSPCNKCYKALIFWGWCYSKENVKKFLEMLKSLNFPIRGKFHHQTVVFYFREKAKMRNFLELLEKKMKEFDVQGKTEWRRACKEYQRSVPEYWKNAKELI